MKRLCATLLAFFPLFLFVEFAVAIQGANQSFRFQAEFPANPKTPFQIRLDYDPNNVLNDVGVANGTSDEQGKIEAKFDLHRGQPFVLIYGRELFRFWAEPEGDLRVVSEPDSDHLNLSGKVAHENRLLQNFQWIRPTQFDFDKKFDAVAFLKETDARSFQQQIEFDEFCNVNQVSKSFRLFVHADIAARSANDKKMVPWNLVNRGKISESDLPEDYFRYWETFGLLDDEAAQMSRRYQSALQSRFQYLAEQSLIADGLDPQSSLADWTKRELEIQAELLANHHKTDCLLHGDKIKFMIQYLPPSATQDVLAQHAEQFPNSPFYAFLNAEFVKANDIDLMAIESRIPFVDDKGQKVSFKEFEGKVVYLHFWGTWCKACMAQKPDFDALAKKYANDPEIVFLSINVHDDVKTWSDHLKKTKNPRGLHWKVENQESESLMCELFCVNAFPRYMLIGKRNQLISPAAPVPANVAIEAAFRSAKDE